MSCDHHPLSKPLKHMIPTCRMFYQLYGQCPSTPWYISSQIDKLNKIDSPDKNLPMHTFSSLYPKFDLTFLISRLHALLTYKLTNQPTQTLSQHHKNKMTKMLMTELTQEMTQHMRTSTQQKIQHQSMMILILPHHLHRTPTFYQKMTKL